MINGLDIELTKELYKCTTEDELKDIIRRYNNDISSASRLSIDEVLDKIYGIRCLGTKSSAIKSLIDCSNGTYDANDNSNLDNIKLVNHTSLSPEVRISTISTLLDEIVNNLSNYYEYTSKIIKKDERLKQLNVSDEDIKYLSLTSPLYVCGYGKKSSRLYIMKRTNDNIAKATKYGDILIDESNYQLSI